ncbi:myosin-2-like [Trifolium medium]|uniref:Myosin-2-like n=1 Tax=Trifolium medium TaxID=97028 RepID=A0A392N804_9FABA|nr:myosin-2-like [Trifolium medium]
MVLSASSCSLTRSSLEEMLESLRRMDEEQEKKKDLPPALPSRPASKARLPPARRSLPNNFKVGRCVVVENGFIDNVESKRKETSTSPSTSECSEYKRSDSSFGRKRVKKDVVESPYVAAISELDGDTISYFIKMVRILPVPLSVLGQSIHSKTLDFKWPLASGQ